MVNTKYEEYSIKLSDGQKEKISHALRNNEAVSIRIEDNGDDKIALTQSQVNKINKAFQYGKSVTIKLSKAQLKYNQNKVQGGFLGALLSGLRTVALPLIKKVAPSILKTIGTAGISSGVSEGFRKLFGNGIYLKRNNQVYKVKDMGSGIFISRANEMKGSGLKSTGDGLYIYNKEDKDFVDGSGFIGDLVSHIPILNLLF